jgi:hypothetical protein
MSALGQKQTLTLRPNNTRFTSKADIEATQTDVHFVPIADIAMLLDHLIEARMQD